MIRKASHLRLRYGFLILAIATLTLAACGGGSGASGPPSNQLSLAISTTSLPPGVVGNAYSQIFVATGGTAPYAWTVTAGVPPPGLDLSATGVISGTPTTVGTFSFTVGVSDSAVPPATASMALSINVTAVTAAVSFSAQIQLIFSAPPANCVNCHGTGGISPNLTSGLSYANLISASVFTAGAQIVSPGSSAASMLFVRVSSTDPTFRMPLGGAPLSTADQNNIKNWIDQGALNN